MKAAPRVARAAAFCEFIASLRQWLVVRRNAQTLTQGAHILGRTGGRNGASMVDLSEKCDVLVIGGGNAALCAAIAARRAGASVLVLEAASKFYRGGNTRHTRNMRCAHDAATKELTGPYSEEEFFDDLIRVTGGNTDEPLARHMIHESKEVLEWVAAQGVRFQPSLGGTLSLGRTNSFFLGGGRAMLNALYRTAE